MTAFRHCLARLPASELPDKVILADLHALMPQDGVSRRHMEQEIGQAEMYQVGLSLQLHFVR